MNKRKFPHILIAAIAFLLLPAAVCAKTVYWYDGGHLGYTVQKRHSAVVDKALEIFSDDMHAVTGHSVHESGNGTVAIYQLDKATNKDMKALDGMKVPYMQFITRQDAYWIGVRGKRVVVVGSNGFGTAYGVLRLSRMAGVSPLGDILDITPERKSRLAIDDGFTALACPAVAQRGIRITGGRSSGRHSARQASLEALALRLGANAMEGSRLLDKPTDGATAFVLDGCELATDKNLGTKALSAVQPGMVHEAMAEALERGNDKAWTVQFSDLRMSAYNLCLAMDMAWGRQASDLPTHYRAWLASLFGNDVAARVQPAMIDYQRLCAMRRPEYMSVFAKGYEFSADEFGNELERHINQLRDVRDKVDETATLVPPGCAEAYKQLLRRPVRIAYDVAEMELEAQEARLIGRKESFHNDDEALEAAARSMKAYADLTGGEWGLTDDDIAVPALPDAVSGEEVERHYDPSPMPAPLVADGCVVRNAAAWTEATGDTIRLCPMLGHSQNAVRLPSGGSLAYRFRSDDMAGALRVAVIPLESADGAQAMTASIDGRELTPSAESLLPADEAARRGQQIAVYPVRLSAGSHTLRLQAKAASADGSSSAVVIDQWMLDPDAGRHFYAFPVK